MARTIASANLFPLVRIVPDDPPATPPSGQVHLFADTDKLLYQIDDAGVVTPLGGSAGSVATDAIWNAAGDLAVGSGSDTAARLALGATDGMVLTRVSSAVAWALPSGYEMAYVEKTSNTSITATSEATGHSVVSAGAVTFDGSTRVCIEYFSPELSISGTDSGIVIDLSDAGTEIGRLGTFFASDAGDARVPVLLRRFLTPSAASHTYAIQAWRVTTNAAVDSGAGGSGTLMPGYVRITKA